MEINTRDYSLPYNCEMSSSHTKYVGLKIKENKSSHQKDMNNRTFLTHNSTEIILL